jgi:hypothetical protein
MIILSSPFAAFSLIEDVFANPLISPAVVVIDQQLLLTYYQFCCIVST